MNMISKKHLVCITILSVLLIITIPTVYKVINNHRTKLYAVVEKEIIEAAENCWNNGDCIEDEITLKKLYDLKYLEKQSDPITKKIYEEDSTIKRNDKKIELNLK